MVMHFLDLSTIQFTNEVFTNETKVRGLDRMKSGS